MFVKETKKKLMGIFKIKFSCWWFVTGFVEIDTKALVRQYDMTCMCVTVRMHQCMYFLDLLINLYCDIKCVYFNSHITIMFNFKFLQCAFLNHVLVRHIFIFYKEKKIQKFYLN